MWLERIKATEDDFELISAACERIHQAKEEQTYIGIAVTHGTIYDDAPTVTMMNADSGAAYADGYAAIR